MGGKKFKISSTYNVLMGFSRCTSIEKLEVTYANFYFDYGNIDYSELWSLPLKMKVYFKTSSQKLLVLNLCNLGEEVGYFPVEGVSMIGFGVTALAIAATLIKDSDGNYPLQWWGLGSLIGYGIYINIERSKVADQFNEDLEKKFVPTIGYNFKFQ